MKRYIPLAIFLVMALLVSYAIYIPTARAATGHVAGLTFYLAPYALDSWPDAEFSPYAGSGTVNCTRDATGVCVVIIDGKTYDQPVTQELDGLVALAHYQTSHDPAELAQAELEANHLISIHIRAKTNLNSWWYPYRFRYQEYNGLVNPPGWYSGMAQGRALELFTELYTQRATLFGRTPPTIRSPRS